ncbi:MAG: hypothetical protein CVV44_05130 [Spirochaetae bacterium HGW-Spirochaetae-1]|jgi:AcrR family transcriptional regulator|nr:MAG: hypothetical protein CVV44_05130 [Spirochaetae bacterium HGW-Spirochaetae-1]
MDTRERIIKTSLALFNEHGSLNITTNHIAKELSISPGNLYYHFRNKEEIIRFIFDRWVLSFDRLWQRESSIPELSDLVEIVDKSCLLFYDYRFFYLDLPALLSRDKVLRERYVKNKNIRFRDVAKIIDFMNNAGLLERPLSGVERDAFINVFWTGTEFLISSMYIHGEKITAGNIRIRLLQFRFLLKPYVKPAVWTAIMQLLAISD